MKPNNARTSTQLRPRRRIVGAAGFTLIEVLLAAGIVVLGMTGVLTMQLVGIRITEDSYHRTKAVTLAYQMTDAVRASCNDPSEASEPYGLPDNPFTACRSGSRNAQDDQTCAFDELSDIENDDDSVMDSALRAWWTNLNDSGLPHWFAEIQIANADVVRISVQWDKERVNDQSPHTGDDADNASAVGRHSCLDNGDRVLPPGVEEVCLSTIPACS